MGMACHHQFYLSSVSIFQPPKGNLLSLSSSSYEYYYYYRHPTHRQRTTTIRGALKKEWREYEDAVKDKDLRRALGFLLLQQQQQEEIPPKLPNDSQSTSSLPQQETIIRDWQVLDTCLNADDMRLVASAYSFLKDKGFLFHFGRYRSIVLDGTRDVTPTVLKSSTGLEVSKLSPKKWGLSTNSSLVLLAFFAGLSYLVDHGIDLRPQLAVTLGLAMADSVFLGGSCLAQISSYWPPYKRRILVHEAGHLLVAYLMGCPIRGVILDPIVAMQMGIQGQAGTQFWDENLQNELAEGRLTGVAFDRYCMVLFGGIAAEALVYGEAEGGENDENLFRSICLLLEPPLSVAQVLKLLQGDVEVMKWAKLELDSTGGSDARLVLEDEGFSQSNLRSHLNLALLDIKDSSLSMSSVEESVSLEDYLRGRWSRSSSFD